MSSHPSGPPIELSIVIPVYNEANNIKATLKKVKENISINYEVIIVYDFDEDTTLPVVRELQKHWSNLFVIKNTVARGPSGAIRTGIASTRGMRVLVLMADSSDDVSQIEYMVSLIPKEADIVCPSRYCPGGDQLIDDTSRLKATIPRLAGSLLRFFSGIQTYDPTNSFKLYSADVLNAITLRSTISFSVTLEIVAKAHCLGFRVFELPTVWKDREKGQSNFKLGRSIFVYIPWFCLALLGGRFLKMPRAWLETWLRRADSDKASEKENSLGAVS